jgi:hypothetical protein
MTIPHGTFRLKMLDVNKLGWLPFDWDRQVHALAASAMVETVLDGSSVTSRELSSSEPVKVGVVVGQRIQQELGWLLRLYMNEFKAFAESLVPAPLIVSDDIDSAININVVKGAGSRYERHVDSNPVTGLLYPSTLSSDCGGGLVFEHSDGGIDRIQPRKGLLIVFDATETTHYVEPLLKDTIRLSIPMNYYFKHQGVVRPTDLDHYLYNQFPSS